MNAARGFRALGGLLVITALASLSGCAFGTRHAELSYPPSKASGVIATAEAAGTPAAAGFEVILAVADMRASTERIGNVRNGFGMDTASVVTDTDVRAWVESAFMNELAGAGYTVIPAEGETGHDTAISLDAELTKVYCDAYLTYDGEVLMTVTLSRQDVLPVEKAYEGSGSVGLSWAATAKSYGESLSLALQDTIRQVMADLAAYRSP
jgi:hypothetical protein